MKKLIKRSIIITLIAFVMLLCINLKSVTASEFTASAKGFATKNLEYVDDIKIENVKMISNKGYNYGSYSMWAANYRYYAETSNGKHSLFLIFFIESAINSRGNSIKRNYFRNKDLNVSFTLESKKCYLVSMTNSENNSTTSESKTIGGDLEIGYNGSVSATANASISITKTTSYNTVTLTCDRNSNNNGTLHTASFNYHFNNYTNGKMCAPNIGYVNKRMCLVYEIENASLNQEEYSYSITTEATIFRDKTWPSGNYTMTASSTVKGNEKEVI